MKIDEIKTIVKLMSDNDLTEFKIESEEMTLCLRRAARQQAAPAPVFVPAAMPAAAPPMPVPAAIPAVQEETAGTLILKDGQLLILRNGRTYNIAGQLLR